MCFETSPREQISEGIRILFDWKNKPTNLWDKDAPLVFRNKEQFERINDSLLRQIWHAPVVNFVKAAALGAIGYHYLPNVIPDIIFPELSEVEEYVGQSLNAIVLATGQTVKGVIAMNRNAAEHKLFASKDFKRRSKLKWPKTDY